MGFYIRKSLSVGPFRFNLSKSGIGVSAGIKGLRIGAGPRGNYVHMGRGGLYYRRTLPGGSHRASRTSRRSTHESAPPPIEPPEAVLTPIDSGPVAAMRDAGAEELLTEIGEHLALVPVAPAVLLLAVVTVFGALAAQAPAAVTAGAGVLGLSASIGLFARDRVRARTVLLYDLEPDAAEAFRALCEAFDALGSCERIWQVAARGEVRDRKRHAGVGEVLDRRPVRLTSHPPTFLAVNVPVPSLPAGAQTLYFLPDRLLVVEGRSVGAVGYDALEVRRSPVRMVEDGAAPGDATVAGRTYRYVNKDGGPDLRFRDNPELTLYEYEQLSLTSRTGLDEVYLLSRKGAAAPFEQAIPALARATGGAL